MTLAEYNAGAIIRTQIENLLVKRAELIRITSKKEKCTEILFRCEWNNVSFDNFAPNELIAFAENMIDFIEKQIKDLEAKFEAIGKPAPVQEDQDEDEHQETNFTALLNAWMNDFPPKDGEKTTLKVGIGNLTIDLVSEWYNGVRGDTEVNFDMLNLCTISGAEIEKFLLELDSLQKKYRI